MAFSRRDVVPSARVFREAGRPARPIPVPFSRRAQRVTVPVARAMREVAAAAIGMFPLTAVLVMTLILLVLASKAAGP